MEAGGTISDESRYQLLVNAITDYAVYMLDGDGIVTSWNAGAERFKGYRPDEIIGQHFSRFYTPEDRAAGMPERALATAAREGRSETEGWRIRKDGTRFWTHAIIDPIRDPEGRIIGFAKITRDLTERRQVQQELEQAREALFQAQKVEALGQMTGGVAHDFNNLLMVIIGSMELLRKRIPDDPRLRSLIDNAESAAQRGASLTKRMLAFARKQDLDRVAVELPALVRGMSDLLERSAGPSVSIRTRFPCDLPKILTDVNQLESALLNLVVNARDAMPDGGPVIISASPETIDAPGQALQPGNYVRFSVEDKGEGMDAETLAKATEPFFTTKGVGKGTGLGLSMVQGFAEQSGGRLALESRKGAGTTVTIWLTAAEEAHDTAAGAHGARGPAQTSRPARLRVLAVDDDFLVLMNTELMLEDLGHEVVAAGSGREALEKLRNGTAVDIVITDHAMPGMTGTQLAETIRQEWPTMPIILATGYAELPDNIQTTLPRLSKPFSQDDLAHILAEVGGPSS